MAFPASINLASLDGTNGFRLDGAAAYDRSGLSVASAGDINNDGFDDLIVGADRAGPNGTAFGSSYVVFGKAVGFDASHNLSSLDGTNGFRLDGAAAYDRSGISVASAGDVNGDGFDDLIIGASFADPNGSASGSSYVVFGKTGGFSANLNLSSLDGTNGFRLDGAAVADYSGRSVASAGDVNGDGYDDLIVGANGADPNGGSSGSSYVVFGKAGGFGADLDLSSLDGTNGFRLEGAVSGDRSGISVASAGDVNGDGFNDLIVGASDASPNALYSGESYVLFGKAGGFDASLDLSSLDGTNGFRLDGAVAFNRSGYSVASAGDVNGDGLADLIVGAFGADPNGSASGSSYVVFGKAGGYDASFDLSSLDGTNGFRLDGEEADDFSGRSVASAGDVNGDGFDDLIIGASFADPNGVYSGSSYVVFGKAGGFRASFDLSTLNGTNGFRLDGAASNDESGASVASAGDVNGDGFDDLIVGASRADPNGESSGSSYVLFGRETVTPVLQSALVDGTTLTLTYDEVLDATNPPALNTFSVQVDGSAADISAVAVSGSTVVLTLASPVTNGQSVTVSYADPNPASDDATSVVQDAVGNDAGSFGGETVTNTTPDTTAPTLVNATANGTALTLTYNEALDAAHPPALNTFFVQVDGSAADVSEVVVSGSTIVLTLALPVANGQSVVLNYIDNNPADDDATGVIQDNAGNDAGSFAGETVTNTTPDTTAPTFVNAAVNGATLVLTYDETLDAINPPAAGDFAVGVDGSAATVSSVAVSGSTVTLTLDQAIANGQSVSVSYFDPDIFGDDTNAIQDAAGNDAAPLFSQPVTNDTVAPTPPSGGGGGTPTPTPTPTVLVGTDGSDTLIGTAGADTVAGGSGNDMLFGNQGDDSLNGNQDNDTVRGGQGNDLVRGGQGDDEVQGDRGNDQVFGDNGNDTINGNQGNDTVNGGMGNDIVHGGQDDDEVRGGRGDDFVFGDRGNDEVWGDLGNDTLSGGTGADTFRFASNSGDDIIVDYSRTDGDVLDFGGQSFTVADVNGSAVFMLSGGGTVVLTGVSSASLDTSDFV